MSEVDIVGACAPKSDQLNADDLINISKTIQITGVKAGNAEQKIIIHFDGDNGKPWKPCKSMIRVLRHLYGDTAAAWVNHSVTLYNDPEVKYGGVKVGGIRISHATGIDQPVTLALTAMKGQRKPYQVKPLAAQVDKKLEAATAKKDAIKAAILACKTQEEVVALLEKESAALARFNADYAALAQELGETIETKRKELSNG